MNYIETPSHIAFAGFSRCGKDTASIPLIQAGYTRLNFGDIIKEQLDTLVREQLGFSAFTEITQEKSRIRATLEQWGNDNYDNIVREYFLRIMHLPDGARVVNTKLMRLREAREWKQLGGVIVLVDNPRVPAFGDFERACMQELLSDATPLKGY